MTIFPKDIIALEEKIQALKTEVDTFAREHKWALSSGHYEEVYNFLGTLKVNTLSLGRSLSKLADSIKINC